MRVAFRQVVAGILAPLFCVGLGLLGMVLLGGCAFGGKAPAEELAALRDHPYHFAYLSMYPSGHIPEELATLYFANAYFGNGTPIGNARVFEQYLKALTENSQEITTVVLGLRPDRIDSGELLDSETFRRFAEAHPETRVVAVLSYPSGKYWTSLSKRKCEKVLASYEESLAALAERNVETYFFGAESWLIENPVLYESDFGVTEEVTVNLIGMMSPRSMCGVTPENAGTWAKELREEVDFLRAGGESWPDLSNVDVVAFGDSIFGNYPGNTGIAGTMARLSGAQVYNLGIGGAQAANREDKPGFLDEIAMLEERSEYELPREDYTRARTALEEHRAGDGRKLVFVVEFGINDYLNLAKPDDDGSGDENTTVGALKSGVRHLQEEYPDAEILVMLPGFVLGVDASQGAESAGEGAVLARYREAVLGAAQELGAQTFDPVSESAITQETVPYYLVDNVHYNERGRYLLAKCLVNVVGSLGQ